MQNSCFGNFTLMPPIPIWGGGGRGGDRGGIPYTLTPKPWPFQPGEENYSVDYKRKHRRNHHSHKECTIYPPLYVFSINPIPPNSILNPIFNITISSKGYIWNLAPKSDNQKLKQKIKSKNKYISKEHKKLRIPDRFTRLNITGRRDDWIVSGMNLAAVTWVI